MWGSGAFSLRSSLDTKRIVGGAETIARLRRDHYGNCNIAIETLGGHRMGQTREQRLLSAAGVNSRIKF